VVVVGADPEPHDAAGDGYAESAMVQAAARGEVAPDRFPRHGRTLIILLCGGDKSTQQADIRKARQIAEDWNRS
jgi:hypothetical protein